MIAPGSAMASALLAAMAVAAVAPLVPTNPLGTMWEDLQRLGANSVLVDDRPTAPFLEATDQISTILTL